MEVYYVPRAPQSAQRSDDVLYFGLAIVVINYKQIFLLQQLNYTDYYILILKKNNQSVTLLLLYCYNFFLILKILEERLKKKNYTASYWMITQSFDAIWNKLFSIF